MTENGSPAQGSQRSRWVFTLNNYDENVNWREHLAKEEHKIKRAFFGYERGAEAGTRHIQGYVELDRSYRLSHVKRILPSAFWDVARRNAQSNYKYCTKGGHYDCIGDFSRETVRNGISRPASVALILRGLLNEKTESQVIISKEYAERHQYSDKARAYIEEVQCSNELFMNWRTKKLCAWQFSALRMIMAQPEREILWIVDIGGNNGKSFLASYLFILYGFHLFDGLVNTRDIGSLLKSSAKGFYFDVVSRSTLPLFDYRCLESIKNGYVVSGKYRGSMKRFQINPVIEFSNSFTQKCDSCPRIEGVFVH